MKIHHDLLNLSYQRAISPNYHGFFERFYEILIDADPEIAKLFQNTDMDRQIDMLMQSMTYLTSFASTSKAEGNLEEIASLHGKTKLNISREFYDVWLDSLIKTLSEYDPKFNEQVETAWREVMKPGLDYMKSHCN